MDQSEWLTSSDPAAMLRMVDRNLSKFSTSDRKLRLFACACRRLADMPWAGASTGWRYMEDHPEESVRNEYNPLVEVPAIHHARLFLGSEALGYSLDQSRMANLLRCIIGNPWRSVTLDPRWLTTDVLAIARKAYDERPGRHVTGDAGTSAITGKPIDVSIHIDDGTLDPVTLSILADALEEAGMPQEVACETCDGRRFKTTGPAGGPRCIRCDNSMQNAEVSGSPGMFRCASCKTTWTPTPCGMCHGAARTPHPILHHLRAPGLHVRGCWALDLALGKE